MTRIAPLLTLLAVAVLGGALFANNYVNTPAAVPAAASSAAVATVPEPVASPATIPPPPPVLLEDMTYAGRTDDREMTVAVAVTGGRAVAYVCGGSIEVWLQGSVSDGELSMESRNGSATLTGAVTADAAEGTFSTEGDEWSFTAAVTSIEDAAADGRDDVAEVAERLAAD